MPRPALIAVCLLALLGTWSTQVQSAEPDNAEIVELRKLLQQSIERIASLEAQVAELKKSPDRSVTEPHAATEIIDPRSGSRFAPRIPAPPRIEPVPDKSNWQKLEIDGKKYYVVPADELPGGDGPGIGGRLKPIRE